MIVDLPVPQRRGESRAAVSIPARVFADGFHQPVELECTSLSSTGMFLRCNPSLLPGEQVLLAFVPPGTWHRIYVDAVVVRAKADGSPGLGLRFARMPRNDTDVLRSSLVRRREAQIAWELVEASLELEFDIDIEVD